jgi:hypothetical protein
MADRHNDTPLLRPRDFFRNSKDSKILEEAKKIVTDAAKRVILDQAQLRAQEDWSYLANKVVGAEGELDRSF